MGHKEDSYKRQVHNFKCPHQRISDISLIGNLEHLCTLEKDEEIMSQISYLKGLKGSA